MQCLFRLGDDRPVVTCADGYVRMDGVGRRGLLAGAIALLLAPTARAAVADAATLVKANSLPSAAMAAYLDQFQDFQRESGAPITGDPLFQAEMAAARATGATRLSEGASFLRDDADLSWIARHYAAQLAAGAPFAHEDAGGRHPGDRIALLHRRMVGVNAENLFTNSVFAPDRAEAAGRLAVDNLMQSPGHRANILDPRWTHAGCGSAAGREGFFLVQLFAERAALLMEAMPVRLSPGAPLPAGCQQAAEGTFSGLALVPMDREVAAEDFMRPGSATVPTRTGPHRSFFARTQEMTARTAKFTIHPGPMLLVN